MSKEFSAHSLDVKSWAEEATSLSASPPLSRFERLLAETEGRSADQPLGWTARGELRHPLKVQPEVWLHLQARVQLSLTCQRCLGPADIDVAVDRSFRFVADEATAAAQDDESEEDLLALSRSFDLMALIEDEVLMALPLVPQHAVCPQPVVLSAADPDFEHESPRENPFAVLRQLQGGKS